MKSVLLTLTIVFSSFSSYANSVEQAQALFDLRSNDATGLKNAQDAVAMISSLASTAATSEEKAVLKLKEAEYIYFVGNRVSGKDKILSTFEKGYEAAEVAMKNLKGSQKAEALYWYAANQGRWGETKGVLASLGRWKSEMKPALEKAISIDKTVHSYGPYRIAGKAFLKVPGESDKVGIQYLKDAYNNTLKTIEVDGEEITISSQINNTVFLLWALSKKDKDSEMFCEVYDNTESLFDGGLEAYEALDSKSVPETEKELKDFFDGKGDFDDVSDYYDENC